MTSFKSAQLIANSQDADKVVFLMDRIELGTQSLKEYKGFSRENESVQATENTHKLLEKLKSNDPANTLIVSSIQKMSNLNLEDSLLQADDIAKINAKRLVFIIDEAHRSTFGDMLIIIKKTFPSALFFGFTGTPIHEENKKKDNTTTTVFGDELHRYSIADGIRDENVLGFDPYKVLTHKDKDLRKAVGLQKSKSKNEAEALIDPKKKAVYLKYMHDKTMQEIEKELPPAQFDRDEHKNAVVEDILENWNQLSQMNKFHAIFATHSISDAIEYYRKFKTERPDLKVSALFDPNIDNNENFAYKEDGLVEIITDYNKRFEQDFSIPTHDKFKKDIAARLAHKKPHNHIDNHPEKQLNLLIVVDQMLTGFDSKWLNTLYLDKVLKYENIIQAFSRTNRLFGPDKPFGTVRYYRLPHTMETHIETAIKMYSGDKPTGLFVEHLDSNLRGMNRCFESIKDVFTSSGIENFSKNSKDSSEQKEFAKQFKQLNLHFEAAKIQGFVWQKLTYSFGENSERIKITLDFDEDVYLVLAMRYAELFDGNNSGADEGDEIAFEIEPHLTEIDTGRIDSDYMNSRFEKYIKSLSEDDEINIQSALNELHKTFARLTQEEQKFASIFLRDVERGNVKVQPEKSFRDYISEYQIADTNDKIHQLSVNLGLDEKKLRALLSRGLTEQNINEYGRFDDLIKTINKETAKAYFEKEEEGKIPLFKVNIKAHNMLKDFLLSA